MPEKKELTIELLSLKDVQPLFGGRNFFLRKDSNCVIQVVTMREKIQERRYKLTLQKEKIIALEQLLTKNDFLTVEGSTRPGEPDEASPTITAKFTSGKEKSVWKWDNDKNPRFDAIYNWILELINVNTGSIKPFYEGRYQYDWKPEGF